MRCISKSHSHDLCNLGRVVSFSNTEVCLFICTNGVRLPHMPIMYMLQDVVGTAQVSGASSTAQVRASRVVHQNALQHLHLSCNRVKVNLESK
jgi:hypothetical protein